MPARVTRDEDGTWSWRVDGGYGHGFRSAEEAAEVAGFFADRVEVIDDDTADHILGANGQSLARRKEEPDAADR